MVSLLYVLDRPSFLPEAQFFPGILSFLFWEGAGF